MSDTPTRGWYCGFFKRTFPEHPISCMGNWDEDDPCREMSYTNTMRSHYCEHIKNWVGGSVEECVYHKKLDKTRPPVLGANTIRSKKQ